MLPRDFYIFFAKAFLSTSIVLLSITVSNAQGIPIFPEAEGFARNVSGGRGGNIIRVTNLNGSGAGSLRDAVRASGARTIVFEVSGTIDLSSSLTINNPDITIAGQSAPSPGIIIKGGLIISTHNVLVQHIRVRSGINGDDGLKFGAGSANVYDVYLDHVSVSWGDDETMSIFQNNNGQVHVISIDHCIISEGLAKNGDHTDAKGFLINKGNSPNNLTIGPLSITNSLFAHNNQRNPTADLGTEMLFANNVVYAYRHTAVHLGIASSGTTLFSGVNNVFKTRVRASKQPFYIQGQVGSVYLSGNELDGDQPSDQNSIKEGPGTLTGTSPLDLSLVSLLPTSQVEQYIGSNVGARPIDRDPVDERVVNEMLTRTGDWMDETEVNAAYPSLAVNSRSFTISNPSGDDDSDGYTNLEELLYEMKLEVEGKSGSVNTSPTISNISDQTIDQDQTLGPVDFTVNDAETANGSLTVTASSSNTGLVASNDISLGGSGSNRTITITPDAGESGTTTITVTVSDGDLQDTETFQLTVNGTTTNTAPTISNISDQTINQDQTMGPIDFTVDDVETSNGSLTVTATSSNLGLVGNNDISLGGSGSNRTITITPDAGESGTTTITVTVSDGDLQDTETFQLTVNGTTTNTAPTISNISDQTIDQDQTMGPIDFTVDDVETSNGSLTVTATSSNLGLVGNNDISLGGSGSNRTITVTPDAGESGTTTITVTVSDGDLQDTETFQLTVNGTTTNTAPSIGNINNQSIDQDQTMGPVDCTVDDAETANGSLTVTATSSNLGLVGNNDISLGGSGSTRTVTATPDPGESGTTTITVTVSDGELQDTETFQLTVNAVSSNTAPTIGNISNQAIDQNQTMGPVDFTVDDAETSNGSLTVTATSSNLGLVGNNDISIGGSGSNRTITVTPDTGESGTTNITVTVSDGDLQDTETFELTVNAVSSNTAPTVSNISNQSIDQDQTMGPVDFTVDDAETSNGSLTVTATSSNLGLVGNDDISLGGSGSNRTITATPDAGESGTATITVTVSDGDLQDTEVFVLTVSGTSGGNSAPNISDISNQSIDQDQTMGPVDFTVGDAETADGSLTVTATSSNLGLVGNNDISLGGNGSDRTITITPDAGESGTATITVTVSDGDLQDTETFVLTVNAVSSNTAPTISDIGDQSIDQDQTMGPIDFTVDDAESADGSLTVTATSSNTGLVGNNDITLGGNGSDRTITIIPDAGESGTTTITVTVSDGDLQDSETFVLTVNEIVSANTAPVISDISNQSVTQDQTMGPISFTVDDDETSSNDLTLQSSCSNTSLVPNNAIIFGGSGNNRTVTVTPATGEFGTATITVTVTDGELQDTETFELEVMEAAETEITFSVTVQDADCEDQNGSIELSVDGGTAPYDFQWSDGPSTSNRDNLSSGTYSITVIDDNSVTRSASFVVGNEEGPDVPSITKSGNLLEASSADSYQWYLEGAAISGANSKTYEPSESGEYTVVVFNENNCSASSDPYVHTISDTEIVGFQIYPIPVSTNAMLNIEIDLQNDLSLIGYEIRDLSGQSLVRSVIKEYSGFHFETALDMSQLAPGVYVIKIKVNREVVRQKLIVN